MTKRPDMEKPLWQNKKRGVENLENFVNLDFVTVTLNLFIETGRSRAAFEKYYWSLIFWKLPCGVVWFFFKIEFGL